MANYPRRYPSRESYLREGQERLAALAKLEVRSVYQKRVGQLVENASYITPLAIIASAVEQSADAMMQAVAGVMKSVNILIQQRPEEFKKLNMQVALAAQRSTLAGLARRQPRRDLPAYRQGATNNHAKRYANGRLRRAIDSPLFFQVEAKQIRFINTTVLNREAVHWRRLNFGTRGGAALRPPGQFRINWGKTSGGGELIAAAFGLDPDVRPAFKIPAGMWLEPGIFFPMGELPAGQALEGVTVGGGRSKAKAPHRGRRGKTGKFTKGIASTNFMDAGVERLAREIGPKYFGMIQDHYGVGPGGQLSQRIQVRVPALRVRGASAVEKGRSATAVYRAGGFNGSAGDTYYNSRGGNIARTVAQKLAKGTR